MLPEPFIKRMKSLLGEEYPAFLTALSAPPVRGVRVNPLKADISTYAARSALPLEKLPYEPCGYLLHEEETPRPVGAMATHHAGEIYMQDPGAMATVAAVDIPRGGRVIDLCAAPGGKSSQIAAALGEEGILVANEYVPARAKIAVANFERLGLPRALVTSQGTARLSALWRGAFDLVLCDAPCSGEGMFRKSEEALADWNEGNVRACAARQKEILNNAAPLVKGGGELLYSTCTYAPEENEEVIDAFLAGHPDFRLIPVRKEVAAVTADGIVPPGAHSADLTLCRRFYPHRAPGEGQFIARMRRECDEKETCLYKDVAHDMTRVEKSVVDAFLADTFLTPPRGRIVKLGERILLVPEDFPLPPCPLLMAGVLLGEIRGKVLVPSHQCYSAFGRLFRRREVLTDGDPRLARYLAGEEIEAGDIRDNGFVAVLYHDAPLGGGKYSDGRIKNHYPKGLRIRTALSE